MKPREMNHKSTAHRRRLMRQIYWHRMVGNLMLRLPWIKRTSPVLIRRVRKLNACCMALYRLEAMLPHQQAEQTAA